ncbi:unnamed protein product, partial [Lymnaea stagnalis]
LWKEPRHHGCHRTSTHCYEWTVWEWEKHTVREVVYPGCFAFSVSHTTRKPRHGEKDGAAYHFVSEEQFKKLIAENGFLEYAKFSGNFYGTSKTSVKEITNSGKLCVLHVEINGVKNIKKSDLKPTPRYIFISPPSLEVLEKRLRDKKTETEESLNKRLAAVKEAQEYALTGAYDFIIVNDDQERAYSELKRKLAEDLNIVQENFKKRGWAVRE